MLLEQFLKQPKNQLFANWALNIWVASPESSSYPQCVVFQHQTPHLEDWDFILFMSYKQWQTSQGLFQVFPKNLHTLSSNHLFVLFILVLKKRIYTLAKTSVLVHSNTTQCWAAEEHGGEQWSAAAPSFRWWLSLLCICMSQSSCSSPFRYPLHPCRGGQGTGKSSKRREGGQKGTYTRKDQAAIGSYSLKKPHKFSPIGKWWEDANSLTKTLKLSWHTAQGSVQEGLSRSPTGCHPAFSCA